MTAQNPTTEGTVTLDGEPVWENRKALEKICFSRELNIAGSSILSSLKVKDYLKAASIYYSNWDADMAKALVQEFQLERKNCAAFCVDENQKCSRGEFSSRVVRDYLGSLSGIQGIVSDCIVY